MKNKIIINFLYKFFLSLSVIFLLLSVYLNISTMITNKYTSNNFLPLPEGLTEIYDEDIAKIDNLKDFKKLVDYEIKKNKLKDIDIPIYIDDIIRRKFFHETAYISADTNWILKWVDYFFPEFFFLTAMEPTELMQKNHGLCSQQSIIFQELIKDYNFEYGSIRLDINIPNQENFGHFTSGVKVGNNWFYFDSNMEPVYNRKNSLIFKKVLEADKEVLERLYPQYNFDLVTQEMINFGDLNKFPAEKGVLFQKITQIFSNFSWLLFLMFSLLLKLIKGIPRFNKENGP